MYNILCINHFLLYVYIMKCKLGKCIKMCVCICEKECVCEHKTHTRFYCPSRCCKLHKCLNYKKCRSKHPLYLLNSNYGYCEPCISQLGPHEIISNDHDECPVCYEVYNKLLKLHSCSHLICTNCWTTITEYKENIHGYIYNNPSCPLCRSINNWESYYI